MTLLLCLFALCARDGLLSVPVHKETVWLRCDRNQLVHLCVLIYPTSRMFLSRYLRGTLLVPLDS